MSVTYNDIVVTGDFNCNILKDNALTNDMLELGLMPTNNRTPTHFTGGSNTLLDIFFVNNMYKTLLYDQIAAPCFSKHDLIYLTYDFVVDRHESCSQVISFRNFNQINYEFLAMKFYEIDWDSIFFMTSTEEQISFLQDKLNNLFNTCVPDKTVTVKNNKVPFINSEARSLIIERNKYYNRWKRYKINSDYIKFKELRTKVTKLVKKLKTEFYEQKFRSAATTKQKWANIREIGICRKKQNIISAALDVEQLNLEFSNSSSLPIANQLSSLLTLRQ